MQGALSGNVPGTIRAWYDADQSVAVFAARLKDTADLDSVQDDLAQVVTKALEPAHISVWMSDRRSLPCAGLPWAGDQEVMPDERAQDRR